MLLLKIIVETHKKVLALIVDRITLQIAARVVTDVLARNEILQDKSKCYNYLKTGHLVKNCTFQHRCFACKLIRLRKITQVKTRHLKMKL